METNKPLLKDENGKEVDVHLYRSMIGIHICIHIIIIIHTICSYNLENSLVDFLELEIVHLRSFSFPLFWPS
jgi:hypothetical protein